MERNATQKLIEWKNSSERKPLILKGARQVGKTWLMKSFGAEYYDSFVYFNFDEEDIAYSLVNNFLDEKGKPKYIIVKKVGTHD